MPEGISLIRKDPLVAQSAGTNVRAWKLCAWAMTGLRQRAGAAMFQASVRNMLGRGIEKAADLAAARKMFALCLQYNDADPRIGVERLKHGTQLLTLGHRDEIPSVNERS